MIYEYIHKMNQKYLNLTIRLLSPDSLEEPTQVAPGDKLFLCKTFAGEASKLA